MILHITNSLKEKYIKHRKTDIEVLTIDKVKELLLNKKKWIINGSCTLNEIHVLTSIMGEVVEEIEISDFSNCKPETILLVNYLGNKRYDINLNLYRFKEVHIF